MINFCKITNYYEKNRIYALFNFFFAFRIKLIWNNLRTRFDLKTNLTVLGTPLLWNLLLFRNRDF